jgi:fatty acid desaturase
MLESAPSNATVGPLLPAAELALLSRRSDARGLLRLLGHVAAIAACAVAYGFCLERSESLGLQLLGAVALGFTLVTMFAAMHECVHRTAFKSRRLNDAVAWLAGLLSFYNSSFYRPYHGWHHRYTQLPGKDPELDDPKPTSFGAYVRELSGVPWWLGKLRTHLGLALGGTRPYPFLSREVAPSVVRSVRFQLGVYALALVLSLLSGRPYFFVYWLVPVALAQPLLRAILLAEHGGCSNDADGLRNTRTTYTVLPVRFLMWQMPYHAEHHLHPALPFFALGQAHRRIGPALAHVERSGYLGFHLALIASLTKEGSP